MGIVQRQAIFNTIFSVIGVCIGAVNTIFILPRAFEEAPDDLGFVRVVLAYATIMGSVFGLGLYNLIIKENNANKSEEYKSSILAYALILSILGLSVLAFIINLFPEVIAGIINKEEAFRLIPNLNSLIVLSFVIILSQYFNSYIITKQKSPFVQLVKDTYLKLAYFILCITYLIRPFSFDLFFNIFVGIYVFSIVLLLLYSLKLGFSVRLKVKLLDIKELLIYGFYTVLDKSATMIVNNLDLVMIGYLLNLSDVGYYSIAFFIGAVIIIPQRAIMPPSFPLVSNYISDGNIKELDKLYKQTSMNQLLIGSVIFALIWVNIDDLFSLMPDNFAPGKWVVFYIGLSKLFILSTGISGPIIILSKHYKINIIFNMTLIFLIIITNYFLIKSYGMTGAAMGTAITFALYNGIKYLFIKSKFDIQPFSNSTLKVVLIVSGTILAFSFLSLQWHPIINIALKSTIVGFALLVLFKTLNVKAEILSAVWKTFKI